MSNKKDILSTLWVFVTLNYLYCDLIGLMDKNILSQFLTGHVEGMDINESFLFAAGVLMEIPMIMIVLSKVLNYRYNRWANIAAATIKTVVMIMTLFLGKTTTYYCFFAIVEISTTLFIIIYAWRWKYENMNAESLQAT